MSSPSFPIIKCSGTAHAVGFSHGTQARALIARTIAAYRTIFKEMAHLSWDSSLAIAEEFLPRLPGEFVEEMRGVAEGAGVPLVEVVALNCRSEIALTAPLDGCTAFSLKAGGTQWLSQNWDWRPSVLDSLIVLDIASQGDRPAMKFVTEAGIIGKIGMNEYGLSVTLNAIRSTSLDRTLLPLHLFLRTLLEQPSLASCLALIKTLPGLASTCHILIADPKGAVGVECAPQGFVLLHPDSAGRVCHTNHFLDEDLKRESGAVNLWEDSPDRLEVVQKRIGEMSGDVSQQHLRDVLADRSIGTKGICRHDSGDGKGSDTLFCITMDCTARRGEVKCGKPDESGAVIELTF